RFHATAIYASGGMVLSGDDLTKISNEKLAMLRKLQPPTGVAARFDDDSLRVGRMKTSGGGEVVCVFNWEEAAQRISFRLSRPSNVSDFWSEEKLGRHAGEFVIDQMPPHSARLLVVGAPTGGRSYK